MSSVQFHMSDAVQRGAEHGMRIGMEAAMKSVLEEVVNKLSEKYEFDAEEAMEFLGVVTFKKPKKSKKVQLPWCGMVIPNCCQALKVNKGLHSQCLNDKVEEGEFCKSCQKDADKNGGTPSKGNATAARERQGPRKRPRASRPKARALRRGADHRESEGT